MICSNRFRNVLFIQYFPEIFFASVLAYSQQSVAVQQSTPWHMAKVCKRLDTIHKPVNYSETVLRKLSKLNDYKRIDSYLDNILIHRPVGTPNHKKVGMYIKTTLENLGYSVEFNKFSQNTVVGDRTFRNIIATLDPLASRRLVLACHYDSKDFRPHFEFMGATDSALPCALLLDIAASLNNFITNRIPDNLTLQLIFFDGEEAFKDWTSTDSIYGARHLSEMWNGQSYPPYSFRGTTELDRIDVLVLLDLLGAKDPMIQNYGINYRPVYQLLVQTERQLMRVSGLNDISTIFGLSDTHWTVEDDHVPFHAKGVNIVHVIPMPFPSVWHRQTDSRDILHRPTIENLATIFRVFTARYLGIRLS